MHAEGCDGLSFLRLPTSVLIAQAVFRLERRQSDKIKALSPPQVNL